MSAGTRPRQGHRRRSVLAACLLTTVGVLLLAPQATAQEDGPRVVDVVQVSGWIDPVVVDFLTDAIASAEADDSEALIVQLDSPGSLVDQERLDALTRRMSEASVPVAVWVGGSGARATGAAGQLVSAAHLSGMAAHTRLGKLPAEALGDLPSELRRDTIGPRRALELGIVQLNSSEAAVLGTFIAALDGHEAAGRTLETASFEEQADSDEPPRATLTVDARLAKLDLGPRLLHTAASPPVAYLLLAAGLGLLVFELFTAGIGIAGLVGAGCLVLASYGLAVLPMSWLGLGLILLGMFGFAVDVQTGAPRVWTGIGVASLVVGSVLLYDDPVQLSWLPLVAGVIGVVLLMLAGLPATVRSRFSTPTIGRESMIGEVGEATVDLRPEGTVRVRDALWPARTNRATPLASGAAVQVIGIDGSRLEVAPLPD